MYVSVAGVAVGRVRYELLAAENGDSEDADGGLLVGLLAEPHPALRELYA